jgi:hypothetical protein
MYDIIIKLIGMIVIGLLSAALTCYRKNYYLRVFDDILGKEETEAAALKLGRSFVYGFLFPIYFVLVLAGLICLVVFLIVAGIIAGIVFGLVWITEKIIPNESLGRLVEAIFTKIGLTVPARPPARELPFAAGQPGPSPAAPTEPKAGAEADQEDNPFPGGGINRTRVHKLD